MEPRQLRVIEQLAERRQLGQGDIMRLAAEIHGQELPTLFDLSRAEADALIVYLDQLEVVGCY